MLEDLKLHYSYIFEKELLEEISKVGVFKEIIAGHTIMSIGQYITSMPLLIEGAIKVLREDDEGDELLLYFLEKGDTCAMTMSCCAGSKKSEIKAITELDSKLVMIPIEKMDEWMGKYKSWRTFVLDSYHNRVVELLQTNSRYNCF